MEDLTGRLAYLPDGQRVLIDYVEDGLATCLRIGGERDGRIAVCMVTSLTFSPVRFEADSISDDDPPDRVP